MHWMCVSPRSSRSAITTTAAAPCGSSGRAMACQPANSDRPRGTVPSTTTAPSRATTSAESRSHRTRAAAPIASANTAAILVGLANARTDGHTSSTTLGAKKVNAEATWAALTSPMAPARPAA